ncbi:LPS-assembly protein LptD [Candidatus Pandoraea novymonadis]|uniref:LPS-assembly protein LptD n=2 Tax=Candidatus Pandoraea novymonadis TaxID=1808959 RepID=A0ABX5FEJ3_9BURK|nr:LPS-assembly protein LptD [Candidatus Pandoraea novymonadis]
MSFAHMPFKQMALPNFSFIQALILSFASIWSPLVHAQKAWAMLPDRLILRTVDAFADFTLPPGQDMPLFLRGRRMEGSTRRGFTVDGEAEARRFRSIAKADRITYDLDSDELALWGNVRLIENGNTFTGSELHMYAGASEGYILTPTYELANRGNGWSQRAEIIGGDTIRITKGTYTGCACQEDPAWYIRASVFEFDMETSTGKAYNSVLFFQGKPIFASPYLSFPTSDTRKSGFLATTFSHSSTTGFELMTPYYFNISPNRDLTITPRMTSKRGIIWNANLRYLEPNYSGMFHMEYLPNDHGMNGKPNRYSYTWSHQQSMAFDIGTYINFTKISDNTYPEDFGVSGKTFQTTGMTRLYNREAGLNWSKGNWSLLARVLKYQVLAPSTAPYERVPQLLATYSKLDWHGFDFTMPVDYTRFRIGLLSTPQPNGERLYIKPTLSYPILRPGYFVIPRVIFNASSYRLQNSTWGIENTINRTLPTFSLDTGLLFERSVHLFGLNMIQTLEPRIFYVYSPYRNQNALPLFDTAEASCNLSEIFSENSFVGNDRIIDANRITMGISSHFMDANSGIQRAHFWLAQRYNLQESRVTLMKSLRPNNAGVSDLFAGASVFIAPPLSLTTALRYSANDSKIDRGDVAIAWHPGERKILNAHYRYLRTSPIIGESAINQVELSGQWPITHRFGVVARLNYSLADKTVIDSLGGLEYDSNCWAFRFGMQRYATNTMTRTTRFLAQMELKGLTKSGTSTTEAFKVAVPNYMTAPTKQIPSRFNNYE